MKTKRIMIALLALGAYFSGNTQTPSWLANGTTSLNINPAGTRIGIGTTTPGSGLHLSSTDYNNSSFTMDRTSGWGPSFFIRNMSGSALTSSKPLGYVWFGGSNAVGTTANSGAYILATSTENWSTSAAGTKLEFFTAPNGTVTPLSRLTIDQDGSTTVSSLKTTGNATIGTTTSSKALTVYGTVGIGTTNVATLAAYKLAVNGAVVATAMDINGTVPASDYVFEKEYKLRTLSETEAYVNEHKHLPEVPSALEFKTNGYSVGKMDDILLRKVEELTLYLIEMQKQNESLKAKVESLEKTIR